jgi:hypothetical protein
MPREAATAAAGKRIRTAAVIVFMRVHWRCKQLCTIVLRINNQKGAIEQ